MDYIFNILRNNPVIPIFLTLGLGFWIGQLKYKSFSLGPVAATLIIGVIIGQIGIEISQTVRVVFFMLFLFSIGYSVGPQFFRSLKGRGLKQVGFAVLEAIVCAATVIVASKIMGYDTGTACGLFAGSQTASASLGVTTDTILGMNMPEEAKKSITDMIPVCYAVTYIFGTIGSAWILSNVGPWLLGGMKKVKEETAEIESKMDDGEFTPEDGMIDANRPVAFRAYRADSDIFNEPRSVEYIEDLFARKNVRLFVERLRLNGKLYDPKPKLLIRRGDTIVLSGRREVIVEEAAIIGPEVADTELLSFGAENLPVTVSKKGAAGITFGEIRKQPYMNGVIIKSMTRNGVSLPARSKTEIQRGDVLTLVGLPSKVAVAAENIGYADRQTESTDMKFVGIGVALGCFIGALSFMVDGVPISLSTSGGALFSGLFFGWLRSRKPTFGYIPPQVSWLFDKLGLNMFIAVIGLTSGQSFMHGISEVGIGLFIVGIIATLIPLVVMTLVGRKIFKFGCAETLGCVAGSRCGVASIGAIQDALGSNLPAIGYTVTYATANFVLIFSSILVIIFM
ncbi:MAG: aspartate-alanine antiporter [Bacteroides sp.]|nr:aspartate-alanine antiporter [Bacteroides sp.]